MQQTPAPLNPWLLSYIRQHHKTRSRYEIDRYLIKVGYNPTEIEVTWQAVLSGSYQKELVEAKDFSRKPDYIEIVGWMVIILIVILLCIILSFWLVIGDNLKGY